MKKLVLLLCIVAAAQFSIAPKLSYPNPVVLTEGVNITPIVPVDSGGLVAPGVSGPGIENQRRDAPTRPGDRASFQSGLRAAPPAKLRDRPANHHGELFLIDLSHAPSIQPEGLSHASDKVRTFGVETKLTRVIAVIFSGSLQSSST